MAATVNVNGRIFDQEHAVVSVFDHGFLYGEGVYETIRTFNGRSVWASADRCSDTMSEDVMTATSATSLSMMSPHDARAGRSDDKEYRNDASTCG